MVRAIRVKSENLNSYVGIFLHCLHIGLLYIRNKFREKIHCNWANFLISGRGLDIYLDRAYVGNYKSPLKFFNLFFFKKGDYCSTEKSLKTL